MLRRNLGRPNQPIQARNVPPALQRANRLMASGQYIVAAEIFENFAQGAMSRNGPRAPWFFLRAGQARLMAGQVQQGMAHIQQGLALFAGRGQFQRLYHAGNRFEAELKARGLAAESKQIGDYLLTTLPTGFKPPTGAGMEKPGSYLPTTCPGCGGPIRSDEVEWIDAGTAECPYCGSSVRAKG